MFVVDIQWLQVLLTQEYSNPLAFTSSLMRLLKKQIGFNLGCVALVEGDTDARLRLVVRERSFRNLPASRQERGLLARYLRIGLDELPKAERSFIGAAAATKKARRTADVASQTFYVPARKDIRSEIAVPVLSHGDVIAVINLESRKLAHYTAEHQRLLEQVASIISPLLDNLILRAGWRRASTDELSSNAIRTEIDRIFNLVPSGIPFEASGALNDVAAAIARALNSDGCEIRLRGTVGSSPVVRGAYGPARGLLRSANGTYTALCSQVIERCCPLRLGPNSRGYPGEVTARAAKDRLPRITAPLLLAPLLSRGQPIGVISVSRRYRGLAGTQGWYTSADEARLQSIQAHVSGWIEIRRFETEDRERTGERTRSLSTLSEIFEKTDLDEALRRAVSRISKLCNGRYCSIFLLDEISGRFVLQASRGLPSSEIGVAAYEPGEGLTGWVAKYGRVLVLDQRSPSYLKRIHPIPKWKEKFKEGSRKTRWNLQPFMAVPIFLAGRTIGVIRVTGRSSGVFSETDVHVLVLMAAYIAANVAHSHQSQEPLHLLGALQAPVVLEAAMQELDKGIAPFRTEVLRQTARRAAEVLKTDVVTLYNYAGTFEAGTFDAPPHWFGQILHPEMMLGEIHEVDAIWHILRNGSCFYEDLPALMQKRRPEFSSAPIEPFPVREKILSAAGIRLEFGGRPVGVMFLNYGSGVISISTGLTPPPHLRYWSYAQAHA